MRMESSRSKLENHRKMEWSSSDGEEVRLYKCNFCERGFSNAQALGGHMNIHRKDRARLKESCELDIPTSTVVMIDGDSRHELLPNPDYRNFLQSVTSDQMRNCTHKRPLIFRDQDDQESRQRTAGTREVTQLPLFLERSSTRDELRNRVFVDGDVEKTIQQTSSLDLDLELRLGPEPHD